jgi:arylsulfatase A-like enzyme
MRIKSFSPWRFAFALLGIAVLAAPTIRAAEKGKPNVIFILADDLGYGDLGCYGQKKILTPNIDKLAAEGTRFTSAYAGSTVCAPSRCALMTGKDTGHGAIRGNVANATLSADETTVPMIFKQAGYTTAIIGKWGLGEAGSPGMPTKKGFDSFYGYLNQVHAHNYYPTFLWRNQTKEKLQNIVPNETKEGAGVATVRKQYSNDLFADEAIKFLDDHKGQQFFLYLPFTIPHANDENKPNGMEVPDLGPYADKNWPAPQKSEAAMITRLDGYVGRIMAKLAELNLDDNTLVFFTSDNGPHAEGGAIPAFFDSGGPFKGIKRDLYEGGIRMPMIARWPAHVPAGSISDAPWAFWDFLPTMAALVDQPAPSGIQGVNVLPTLLGQKQNLADRYFFWQFHEGTRNWQAIRWQNWKAVQPRKNAKWELYDLSTDPGEAHNVAASHPDVMDKMKEHLKTAIAPSPEP